jgi:hypothetical protein
MLCWFCWLVFICWFLSSLYVHSRYEGAEKKKKQTNTEREKHTQEEEEDEDARAQRERERWRDGVVRSAHKDCKTIQSPKKTPTKIQKKNQERRV